MDNSCKNKEHTIFTSATMLSCPKLPGVTKCTKDPWAIRKSSSSPRRKSSLSCRRRKWRRTMPQDEMTVEKARNNLQELKEGDLAGIAKGPPTEDEAQEEAPAEEAFLQLPPNLANKPQLVAKAITKIEEYFRTFDAQSPRTKAKSDWKEADARYRVSKSKANKNPTNQEDNRLANVPSTSFYNSIRITTAGQKAIIYYGDNLPVEYTPAIGSPDFPDDAEAKRIADEQNFLLWYTWHKANVETATKPVLRSEEHTSE